MARKKVTARKLTGGSGSNLQRLLKARDTARNNIAQHKKGRKLCSRRANTHKAAALQCAAEIAALYQQQQQAGTDLFDSLCTEAKKMVALWEKQQHHLSKVQFHTRQESAYTKELDGIDKKLVRCCLSCLLHCLLAH